MAQQQNVQSAMFFTAAERSQRSVFVGNIPYEATEEELKVVFSQVGPVVNFRLVFDRESGKPKGYGFCEYLDADTAMSAMRNLNNVEFHGRVLRVDTATGDRNKEEIRQLQMTFGGPQEESPYGPPVESEKAPEAISRAVASLPPEQMFELMKQMKLCIQNNPNEARNMLLQNPQLAYALLQAQVVMRIVDPQVAIAMLHRESLGGAQLLPIPGPAVAAQPFLPPSTAPIAVLPTISGLPIGLTSATTRLPPPVNLGMGPPSMALPQMVPPNIGPMLSAAPVGDVDYRQGVRGPPPTIPPPSVPPKVIPSTKAGPSIVSEDQEKAQLIMQVIQLTDEQIAMLPPDQRQSVLILKEQLKNQT